MRAKWSWKARGHRMRRRRNELLIALLCMGALRAIGAPPDWLQAAYREPIPQYPDAPAAVMLRNEQIATVKGNGEVTTVYRRAFRILRPEGRAYGVVRIYFDSETRITFVKGWSIPAAGGAYEVGEKESVDSILFNDNLYEDARQKVLRIPGAEAGAVVGYEYEQHRRPSILQDEWLFQQEVPVLQARFDLHLPPGWEYGEFWANHAAASPQSDAANHKVWELKEIPAVKIEPAMPPWQAVAGQLFLRYISPKGGGSFKSWSEVGQWYAQLAADRRQPTAELRQRVAELTATSSDTLAKIQALASFVQQEVRYVAVEIGIGGYQPHPAQEVLKNRYGDCKDKATLLSTMLREIGVESFYVLTNSRRGVIRSEFPSPLVFNHAILAIHIPADTPGEAKYSSTTTQPRLGSLLFFDPTDPYVQLGYLPSDLQANSGLLVENSSGELVDLPLSSISVNTVRRTATLELTASGDLHGEVHETRSGDPAADFRGVWLNSSESGRKKAIQDSFGRVTTGVELEDVSVIAVDKPNADSELKYAFRLARYATSAGGLLLLRPRALGEWADDVMERGDRKQPVAFRAPTLRTEIIEITLPEGYAVDELPPPVEARVGAVRYSSKTEAVGRAIHYSRRMEINEVLIPSGQLSQLKSFYRQVAADEKGRVVLKKQ